MKTEKPKEKKVDMAAEEFCGTFWLEDMGFWKKRRDTWGKERQRVSLFRLREGGYALLRWSGEEGDKGWLEQISAYEGKTMLKNLE